ncbi:MAG: hypothetical protein AAFP77_02905 [Bacteroidota bacterium]
MRLFYLTILFFGLLSCESATHVDIDAVIEEKVQERLDEFRRVINERCEAKALEEAGMLADSIIIAQARLKQDTSNRPPRPLRPDQPEPMTLEDSLELAPLFDTTLLDTVGGN